MGVSSTHPLMGLSEALLLSESLLPSRVSAAACGSTTLSLESVFALTA